ncbi:MAG: hypothetical protein NVS3B26_20700 [Mycobacteriales bacterium]
MPRPAPARRAASTVVVCFALSTLAACSSAPAAPTALSQSGGLVPTTATGTPTALAAAGASAGPATTAVGAVPGSVVALPGGGTVTTVVRNGVAYRVVTRNGRTTTTRVAASSTATVAHSQLFTPAENTIGITRNQITLCAHAALTYAKAFHTDTSDLNVFWTALNAEHNGIFGRQVVASYENDNYDPATAVQAATTCKAKNPFMLLGGIGFDQIPAVRNWAEQNHELYLYHTATIKGSEHLQYSFTELPTVEKVGAAFGTLVQQKYRGHKVGIIERDSENWSPGADAFKAACKAAGIQVVADDKVPANAGNYTNQILDMRNASADVVFVWLNALESTEVIKQAKSQQYNPHYLLFPFNLTSQTLGSDAMNPPLDGVAMYPAYSKGDYSGPFAGYADDMKEFEREYATYDPSADLSGNGGDLLFLNWTAQKALAVQLTLCGLDCTRNKFIDVLQGYQARPSSSSCPIDFVHSDGHHGLVGMNFMETYRSPSGAINWRNTSACVGA